MPAKKKTTAVTPNDRLMALATAQKEVGTKEVPMGSNWGPRVSQYLNAAGISVPAEWCAAFVTWCYDRVGKKVTFPGPALVQNWDNWAAAHGEVVIRPFRGDLVTFDWDNNNWFDHIGIVEKVLALRPFHVYWFRSIEGNSGDMVARRWHWSNAQGTRFLRIKNSSPL